MLEGDMDRDFGAGGLGAWLGVEADPATNSGRDMPVGYGFSVVLVSSESSSMHDA